MSSYVIVTDSSSDLSSELLKRYNVFSIPLAVTMDGKEPVPNDEIDTKAFYAFLRSKKGAKTSAVAIETFKEVFKTYLDAGKDVLYLGFSSGLSGTYNAGFVAAKELS